VYSVTLNTIEICSVLAASHTIWRLDLPIFLAPMRPSTLLFLVVPPLMWASNAIVGRMAAGAIPPITLNFLRWVVAILVLLPFVWQRLKQDWPIARKSWVILAATGFLSTTTYNA
jgi:drug/metabolite transporter (DMT)-like permease